LKSSVFVLLLLWLLSPPFRQPEQEQDKEKEFHRNQTDPSPLLQREGRGLHSAWRTAAGLRVPGILNMKFILVIIALASAFIYKTSDSKKTELVGTWRTRVVHAGLEILGTLDLKESGEIVFNGEITPLDPTLYIAGCVGPDGRPGRTFNFVAKGEWSVRFSNLMVKFRESNPRCLLPFDDLYGGKVVSIDSRKLVLHPRKEQDRPPGMETETWYR
jgi:hypothetical protein